MCSRTKPAARSTRPEVCRSWYTDAVRNALIFGVLGFLAASCAQTQIPYRFKMQNDGVVIDRVVRALAVQGVSAALIDPQAGIIHGPWQDTGFLYGSIDGVAASIVRRYIVILQPAAQGVEVVVRADTQRCAQGSAIIAGPAVSG